MIIEFKNLLRDKRSFSEIIFRFTNFKEERDLITSDLFMATWNNVFINMPLIFLREFIEQDIKISLWRRLIK